MNVDEVLRRLADTGDLPREALHWSLDHWDEASPRFIAKLRAYAHGGRATEEELDALFFIIHLCAEKRDERAYTAVCEMIAADETLFAWLGDAVTETLSGVLINLCDGDVEPLKRAIESASGDEFGRGAALDALAYLVRARNLLTDEEMREYLAYLRQEMKPREENHVWVTWAFTIARLGYEPLRAEVARVFTSGWIDPNGANLEDFYAELQVSRRDPDGLAAFRDAGIKPFDSTIETFADWRKPSDDELEDEFSDDWDGEIQTPHVNPLRDVGRNDPCPCGSGKKFKKCCLAA